MKHYVKKKSKTNSVEGQMLDQMYGWCMKETQELIYDDVEKTLILYDNFYEDVVWREDNYDINADMHSYQMQL